MWIENKRELRRAQAARVVARRIADYRSCWAGSYVRTEDPRRVAESGRLRKGSAFGCNCRKRARGAPHLGGGICHFMVMSPVVLERREGRRQCQEWLRSATLDDDPAARRPVIERTW